MWPRKNVDKKVRGCIDNLKCNPSTRSEFNTFSTVNTISDWLTDIGNGKLVANWLPICLYYFYSICCSQGRYSWRWHCSCTRYLGNSYPSLHISLVYWTSLLHKQTSLSYQKYILVLFSKSVFKDCRAVGVTSALLQGGKDEGYQHYVWFMCSQWPGLVNIWVAVCNLQVEVASRDFLLTWHSAGHSEVNYISNGFIIGRKLHYVFVREVMLIKLFRSRPQCFVTLTILCLFVQYKNIKLS